MMKIALHSLALLCFSLSTACVDGTAVDPAERYPDGPFEPCEVSIGNSPFLEAYQFDLGNFHRPGPWATWNTHPAAGCNFNPKVEAVGDESGVELYMTYPVLRPPTQTGDGAPIAWSWPVILFAHSNHDRQCEVFESYYSLHDHWASWGFVVASVDATSSNCQPGNRANIEHRVDGLHAGLERLRELNADPSHRFYGKLNLDRVFFAGHSRGGAAALLAAEDHGGTLGAIALQAVDLTRFGFGRYPLRDVRALAITAGNDVDLEYPVTEPNEDQLERAYTWVDIHGASHANTGDAIPLEHDDAPEISKAQQHDVQEYFTTAFLMRNAGRTYPETFPVLFGLEGARKVFREMSQGGVAIRWRNGVRAIWVDRFDGDTPDRNELGGAISITGGDVARETPTYRPGADVEGTEWDKSWSLWLLSRDELVYRSELPALELDPTWNLMMRIKGADRGWSADLTIVLEAANGERVEVDARDFIGPVGLRNRFTQVVVPLSAFGSAAERPVAIELRAASGQIFVDDLRFSSF